MSAALVVTLVSLSIPSSAQENGRPGGAEPAGWTLDYPLEPENLAAPGPIDLVYLEGVPIACLGEADRPDHSFAVIGSTGRDGQRLSRGSCIGTSTKVDAATWAGLVATGSRGRFFSDAEWDADDDGYLLLTLELRPVGKAKLVRHVWIKRPP